MKLTRYDEFQLSIRHRIAFQTMIITFIMIMISGYVKTFYGTWANPMLEMLVLIMIPAMYFSTLSIAKNAYLQQKDQPALIIILMGLAAVLSGAAVTSNILNGMFTLIENGQLSNQIGSLLLMIYSGGTAIALLIRRTKNRRMMEKEE
ncbi:hypothetical protein [Sporosarcina cascadiensis]|uniref:hypothetical protein n=1 Tax=Sporosarcina cascadiensis TaxID=2660747 RepID=UPI00129B8E00|nr:hypothetical protein [Sporosarcina cascadiensis]